MQIAMTASIIRGNLPVGVEADLLGSLRENFQSRLGLFFSALAEHKAPRDRNFRVGGLVEAGSVVREKDALTVRFNVTDTARTIPVVYTGILPDLFREGKGVVAQGRIGADGIFRASEVLAKHDENYMPPEAAEALKKAGHPIDKAAFAGQKKGK